MKGIDTMMNTSSSVRMTYVMALDNAINALANMPEMAETIEKLTALKVQTEKRNSADRKPTKTQTANLELQELVVEVLRNSDKAMTITEIMNADDTLGTLSNQKVAALVRGLGDRVIKTLDKRKAYFTLA